MEFEEGDFAGGGSEGKADAVGEREQGGRCGDPKSGDCVRRPQQP